MSLIDVALLAHAAMLGWMQTAQEKPMSRVQHAAADSDTDADESKKTAEELFPPTPDEDGPHDVPDETVIEKTLPSGPVPEISGDR